MLLENINDQPSPDNQPFVPATVSSQDLVDRSMRNVLIFSATSIGSVILWGLRSKHKETMPTSVSRSLHATYGLGMAASATLASVAFYDIYRASGMNPYQRIPRRDLVRSLIGCTAGAAMGAFMYTDPILQEGPCDGESEAKNKVEHFVNKVA